MRIVTWNVWHRFGGNWEERGEAIIATLTALKPDVVCLQEVWTDAGSGTSQAAMFGEAVGLAHTVDGTRADWNGVTFGNAVLSRWPITKSAVHPLPVPDPEVEERRCAVATEIKHPDGPLQVFTTHLNYQLHQSSVRVMQTRSVAELMSSWRHKDLVFPQILTGDMNAEPDSDEIRQLVGLTDLGIPFVVHDVWRQRGDGAGHTWSNDNPRCAEWGEPDRRIDYIFYGDRGGTEATSTPERCSPRAVSVAGNAPVKGVWPSDHAAVVADFGE